MQRIEPLNTVGSIKRRSCYGKQRDKSSKLKQSTRDPAFRFRGLLREHWEQSVRGVQARPAALAQ